MPKASGAALGVIGLLLVGLDQSAWARDPSIRVERIDSSRCSDDGFVEIAFVELELEGTLRSFPAADYQLVLDERLLATAPSASVHFAKSDRPLAVAILLQHNLANAAVTADLARAVGPMIRGLPPRAQVALIPYDGAFDAGALEAKDPTADRTEQLVASTKTGAALVEASRAALDLLESAGPGARRLLIIVSDGIDDSADRDTFRGLGNLARARSIPIHPIAFSPTDDRGPLLNLGEIAKRSNGTFRLAETAADLSTQIANLGLEIDEQLVTRFEIADDCEQSHLIQVAHQELRSGAQTVAAVPQHGPPLAWVIGAGVAISVLGVAIAIVWARRRR